MKVLTHFVMWRFGLAKPWTFYGREESEVLRKYALGRTRLAELGCWQGVNTARIRKAMSPNGILFAVDPYPKGGLGFNAAEIIAHEEVEKIKNGSVCWLRMTDLSAAEILKEKPKEKFDFIFSDTLNTYEGLQKSWSAWKELLAPGGVYIIANSRESATHPIKDAGSVCFTREVILNDPQFSHLESAGCFTVLRKKP